LKEINYFEKLRQFCCEENHHFSKICLQKKIFLKSKKEYPFLYKLEINVFLPKIHRRVKSSYTGHCITIMNDNSKFFLPLTVFMVYSEHTVLVHLSVVPASMSEQADKNKQDK